jgi:nitrate reductase cytochrome c-type subunit
VSFVHVASGVVEQLCTVGLQQESRAKLKNGRISGEYKISDFPPFIKSLSWSTLVVHTMTSSVKVESLEDLALLNEDNAIRILLNGTTEKYLASDWIEGDHARGANSVLAKMVLGTSEGLAGTSELQVEETLVGVFDLILLWLALGDAFLKDSLTDENATLLMELALYFGLDALAAAITEEEKRREEAQKRQEELIAQAAREKLQREARMASNIVRCVSCGSSTTKAPTYRGNTPRCLSCRNRKEADRDYADDWHSDRYYDDRYDSDDYDYDNWSYQS